MDGAFQGFYAAVQPGDFTLEPRLLGAVAGDVDLDAVLGRGALKKAQLVKHLLPKLDPQALLVTDANVAYRGFADAAVKDPTRYSKS